MCSFELDNMIQTASVVIIGLYGTTVSISGTPLLLDNSTHASVGLVRFQVNSTWGIVCPMYWDDSAANVTCKMLKYTGGIAYFGFSKMQWPVVFNGIRCLGNEVDIADCAINCAICDEPINNSEFPGAICYNEKSKSRLGLQWNVKLKVNISFLTKDII